MTLAPVTLFNGWLGRCSRCGESVIEANGWQGEDDEARHFDCDRASALTAGVRVHVVIADLERHLAGRPDVGGFLVPVLRALPDVPDAFAALDTLTAARAVFPGEKRIGRAIAGISFAIRRMMQARPTPTRTRR